MGIAFPASTAIEVNRPAPWQETRRPENGFDGPQRFLNEVLHEAPYLNPIMQELSHYPKEFWHSVMVGYGYDLLTDRLADRGLVSGDNLKYIKKGRIGAMLHDIGKLGIAQHSIEESLAIMDWTPTEFDKVGNRRDNRPPDIRAAQHLHPLVGKMMIEGMAEDGIIPQEDLEILGFAASEHHKTPPDNRYKTSYNGDRFLDDNKLRTVVSKFVQWTDVPNALRENRPYRTHLGYGVVREELGKYLSDWDLFTHIKDVFNLPEGQYLSDIIYAEVLGVEKEVDRYLRKLPKGVESMLALSPGSELPKFRMEDLIARIWSTRGNELSSIYYDELAKEYFHDGRTN